MAMHGVVWCGVVWFGYKAGLGHNRKSHGMPHRERGNRKRPPLDTHQRWLKATWRPQGFLVCVSRSPQI